MRQTDVSLLTSICKGAPKTPTINGFRFKMAFMCFREENWCLKFNSKHSDHLSKLKDIQFAIIENYGNYSHLRKLISNIGLIEDQLN